MASRRVSMTMAPANLKSLAKQDVWRIALLVSSCVLLHFMIVQPLGYPLTVAPVAIWLLLAWEYHRRVSVAAIAAWIVLLLVPFINVVGAPTDTYLRFFRTYALWAFTATVVWWAAYGRIKEDRGIIGRGAFAALVVIAAFSAAQSGLAFLTGSSALFNLFGAHQYLYSYDIAQNVHGAGAWSRAQGFYLEPSFGALVMVTLCVVCMLSRYRERAAMLILGGALFFNRSFSGIITFAFILAIWMSLSLGAQVSRRVKFAASVLCVVVAVFILQAVAGARVSELNVEGASAYYRLVAPLIVLRDVLLYHPFGVELGQVEAFLVPYGLLQTGAQGTTLDNGLYVLLFYFGWLGVVAVVGLMTRIGYQIIRGHRESATVWSYVLFSLAFSGGIFVPEYAFLLTLVCRQYRAGSTQPASPATLPRGLAPA